MFVRPLKRAVIVSLALLLPKFAWGDSPSAAEHTPIPPAYIYCTVCHGANLQGNINTQAPRLTGLSSWYIEKQLRGFQAKLRGYHQEDLSGQQMQSMTTALSDKQIVEVAEIASGLLSLAPDTTVSGDAAAGEVLYRACAACHGPKGQGNKALGSPALTGLNDWYLRDQLQKFRSGQRGTQAQDSHGALMLMPAKALKNDADIDSVVSYIQQINTP